MMIAEMLVQNGEEDDDSLHMKAAPVNMRLFKSNKLYRSIIMRTIHLMSRGAAVDFEDYPKAQGVSGANIGVPFNIVIVVTKDSSETFLNPTIIDKSILTYETKSNCGSINLDEPIKVERHRWITVEWFDITGDKHRETFTVGDDSPVSCATLQHEIEHNLGILITDKEIE